MILYSVVAGARDHNVPIEDLYLAGLFPGLLMLALVAAYAVRTGIRLGLPRYAFSRASWGPRSGRRSGSSRFR